MLYVYLLCISTKFGVRNFPNSEIANILEYLFVCIQKNYGIYAAVLFSDFKFITFLRQKCLFFSNIIINKTLFKQIWMCYDTNKERR